MDKWMVRRKEGGLVGDRMGELGCLGDAAVSSSYYDEGNTQQIIETRHTALENKH